MFLLIIKDKNEFDDKYNEIILYILNLIFFNIFVGLWKFIYN